MMSCQQVIARVIPRWFPCRVPQLQSLNTLILVIITIQPLFTTYSDNPTLPEIQKFLSSIQEPVVFDKVFTEIVQ